MEHVMNGAQDNDDSILMAHLDDLVDTYSLLVDENGSIVKTHGVSSCGNYEGGDYQNCPIHNPSDHHMADWPMRFSMTKQALVERECIHGQRHPDPDSLEYHRRMGGDSGFHSCDSCCILNDFNTHDGYYPESY